MSTLDLSHSNAAAPIHFLHYHCLADFQCHIASNRQSNNYLSDSASELWKVSIWWTETGQLVNTAPLRLQLLAKRLHKFSLRTSGQQRSSNALQTSILWMFPIQDHLVNCSNLTSNEMVCHNTPADWGSDAFGQRLDSNAAILPNSLTRINATRLDSKASNSGSSKSNACAVWWISNLILKL